ncbi:hypothetical protein CRG98_022256 [Punica granatum]|uniref:Uncharacterized protein n=1 Tax=Punica granatum TaxID=22663 RepID=A0A2I0JMA6_PUNGR|nr:hypothetical protein CRG98_022256 [Punica granatum]
MSLCINMSLCHVGESLASPAVGESLTSSTWRGMDKSARDSFSGERKEGAVPFAGATSHSFDVASSLKNRSRPWTGGWWLPAMAPHP